MSDDAAGFSVVHAVVLADDVAFFTYDVPEAHTPAAPARNTTKHGV